MRRRNQYTSLRGFSQGSIIRNPICGHLCVPPGVAEALLYRYNLNLLAFSGLLAEREGLAPDPIEKAR
jgi:hypothetical protein